MTNEEMLDDIKQYMDSRLAQTEDRVINQLRGEIKETEGRLVKRMDDGFAAAAATSGDLIDRVDALESAA